jgi:hypothetical protein
MEIANNRFFELALTDAETQGNTMVLTFLYKSRLERPVRVGVRRDGTYVVDEGRTRHKHRDDNLKGYHEFSPGITERFVVSFGEASPSGSIVDVVLRLAASDSSWSEDIVFRNVSMRGMTSPKPRAAVSPVSSSLTTSRSFFELALVDTEVLGKTTELTFLYTSRVQKPLMVGVRREGTYIVDESGTRHRHIDDTLKGYHEFSPGITERFVVSFGEASPSGSIVDVVLRLAGSRPGCGGKEGWRMLPVSWVNPSPAACLGGHRRHTPWKTKSGRRRGRMTVGRARSAR